MKGVTLVANLGCYNFNDLHAAAFLNTTVSLQKNEIPNFHQHSR